MASTIQKKRGPRRKPAQKPGARRKPAAAAPKAPPVAAGDPDLDAVDRATPALTEVDDEVLEFIAALDRFKKQHSRPFPSWSEVLLVLRELGYEKR